MSDTPSLIQRLFIACQGRHTTFAVFFSLVGTALQWFHRLDATYISFMTLLMGFILGHSTKESLLDKPAPAPAPAP